MREQRSPGRVPGSPPSPGRINHRTLHMLVYDELRSMILSGRIPFGAQLDEQSLAERMGVSRTPLREAIAKLVKENLVEHRPWKGHFVRTPSVSEVNDLYEVRKALEALATRLAVPRMSDADIATIRGFLEEAGDALARHDLDAYGVADRRFHRTIATLSGNVTLVEMLDQLSSRIHVLRNMVNQDPDVAERTARERPLILMALANRDAERAAQLMSEHIEDVRQHAIFELTAREASAGDPSSLVSPSD